MRMAGGRRHKDDQLSRSQDGTPARIVGREEILVRSLQIPAESTPHFQQCLARSARGSETGAYFGPTGPIADGAPDSARQVSLNRNHVRPHRCHVPKYSPSTKNLALGRYQKCIPSLDGLAIVPKWHGGRDLLVSVHLAHRCQLKWANGWVPPSDHRHGTCDTWHAPPWWSSQVGRWAWLLDVGGQRRPWTGHHCSLPPPESMELACEEPILKTATGSNGAIPLSRDRPPGCV